MYQGKFEQDNPTPAAAESEVVPTPDAAAEEMEFQRPVRRQRKQKKPMRTRDLVFWICVLSFVLVAVVAICIGLSILKDWLINFEYESTLPETKSQAIFDQFFADPDWEQIYKLAKEPNTKFENSASYAAYMEQLVGDQELRHVKISAGLTNNCKYEIRMGNKKIAGFTLLDSTTADGKKDLTLGDVEIVYERKEVCTVLTVPGAAVKVNGVTLDDSYVVKTVSTNAPEYLPANIRGYEAVLYRVDNLMVAPTVTVTDASGNQIALDYDKDTKAYSHFIGSVEITEAESTRLVDVAKVYCKYMIGQANKTTLQQYFDPNCESYKTMTGIDKWMQSYKSYSFDDPAITEYYRYSDTLYSGRVEMTLLVTRKDGTVKEYPLHSTFILQQQDGVWKAINMLNLSIQQPKISVRLTYIAADGETLLQDEMVDAQAKSLTAPAVEVPEGKQLGWYTKTVKENGNTTMSLMFQPDETGKVTLPADNVLEPMVLYARLTDKEA